jgi:hypothetical protein
MSLDDEHEEFARQPHDAVFKRTVGAPEEATGVLRSVLPPRITEALDWPTLVPAPTNVVDDLLVQGHRDLVFEVGLRRGGRTVRALAVLIFEHLSAPDRHAQLRLLGYQLRTWERERGADPPRPLPPVIPVVLSQGPTPWCPPPLLELLDVDDAMRADLEPFTPRFVPAVLDLALRSEESLAQWTELRPLTRAALILMKIAQDGGDVHQALPRVVALFPGPVDEAGLRALWMYALAVTQGRPSPDIVEQVRRAATPAAREVVMTALDHVLGEAEAKGQVKGASAVLERLLRVRFGPLEEETLGRLRGATVEELAAWGERMLGARSLAEVFGQ